jgi:hypothetical protein
MIKKKKTVKIKLKQTDFNFINHDELTIERRRDKY